MQFFNGVPQLDLQQQCHQPIFEESNVLFEFLTSPTILKVSRLCLRNSLALKSSEASSSTRLSSICVMTSSAAIIARLAMRMSSFALLRVLPVSSWKCSHRFRLSRKYYIQCFTRIF